MAWIIDNLTWCLCYCSNQWRIHDPGLGVKTFEFLSFVWFSGGKKFRVQNEKYIGVYLHFFSLKPLKRASSTPGSNPCIYLVFGCLLSWNKQAEGVSKCLICVSLCVTDMCGYIRSLQFFQTITIWCLFVSVDVSGVCICVGTSWCHGQCFESWIKYWTGDISGSWFKLL